MARNGGGQIIKRGRDRRTGLPRYLVKVYLGRVPVDDPQPRKARFRLKYRSETVYGDRRAAEAKLGEMLGLKARRSFVPRSNRTVAEYIAEWLSRGCPTRRRELPSERTRFDYKSDLERYAVPIVGGVRLDALDSERVQRWIGELEGKGLAPRTVAKAFAALRAPLNKAKDWGYIAASPCEGVTLPRSCPRELHTLGGADSLQRFVVAARSDRYNAMWLVLLFGGLRPGEAASLRWDDLQSGVLRVRRSLTVWKGRSKEAKADWTEHEPKTRRSRRTVPLPDLALAALREWKVRQNEERLRAGPAFGDANFIFTDEIGRPVHATGQRSRFQSILISAGLPTDLRVYDLRHSCATLLLADGEHVKVVSERLGHSSTALTLDVYSAVLPGMQEAATKRFDRMLG